MSTPRWHAVVAAVGSTCAATALFLTAALAAVGAGSPGTASPTPYAAPGTVGRTGLVLGPTAVPRPAAGPSIPSSAVADATGRDGDGVAPNGVDLFRVSAETGHDLPVAAKRAYVAAARTIGRERPDCSLPWELVAGIGRVESDHGRYGGSRLGDDGVSRPLIRGIALDGVGPVAAIRDTDRGRLDGDRVWDRAVGPMQFIPSTWRTSGRDGDGDGRRDPDDLDDAALATASYLCPAAGSIDDESVMRAQVFSYNHSDYYVDLVIAFAVGYRTGVFDIPPPPVEPTETPTDDPTDDPTARAARPTRSAAPSPTRAPTPTRTPTAQPTRSPAPTPQPTRTPAPTATPTPTPAPPTLSEASGAWTPCGTTWCLAGVALDLGGAARYAVTAAEDFDRDGTVETNRAELDGLVGRTVTVQVKRRTAVVYLVDGLGYRNADGSFAGP